MKLAPIVYTVILTIIINETLQVSRIFKIALLIQVYRSFEEGSMLTLVLISLLMTKPHMSFFFIQNLS